MILAFELSMPGRSSWNGRWSGENKKYVRVQSFRGKAAEHAKKLIGYHAYRFTDGWCAGINVREVDSSQSRKLRSQSDGFCGYDWMIKSLLDRGYIISEYDLRRMNESNTVQ